MRQRTAELWAKQDRPAGDRWRLFRAVAEAVDAVEVLYPGSYVDVAPSFVWPAVTYVDLDRRAAKFFDDRAGVLEIVRAHAGSPAAPHIEFVQADYSAVPVIADVAHDLLLSLYAGPISRHCTGSLRVGGHLLVNPSHGDAALASLDDRYALAGAVWARSGTYSVTTDDLDSYLVPKRDVDVTVELIERTGRGVGYTRSPFAYLFRRVR